MMYFRWLLLAPISLLVNILVMLTSPVWALWAAALKLEKLPGWFALLHTHDDNIYGANLTKIRMPARFIDRFKTAVWWLCRNPSYGFDAKVLGFKHVALVILSDSNPKATFDRRASVSRKIIMRAANGRKYFTYRADIILPLGFWAKIFIGWNHNSVDGQTHMIKIMFNPFRRLPK
ncbi:hypothetical protein [Aminobacter phage Erebus]|nr:hypothetical protein [Aminobacter phage Erebus]